MPLLPRHRAEAAAFRARRRGHPSIHELEVAAVAPLTDDAVMVTFAVPSWLQEAYRFKHGQHVALIHPHEGGEIRRSYSICAPATEPQQLRVAIRLVPGGAFSVYATERLKVGDTLRVMTPTGSFTTELEPQAARRYVALAGGSGITPIVSMLATILTAEPQSRLTLLYANRSRRSTMFLPELAELEATSGGRLAVHHYWSREPPSGDASARRLDRAALEQLLVAEAGAPPADAWLMCGPAALMHDATELLLEHGVAPERIHRELFSSAGEPVDPPDHDRPLLTAQVELRFDEKATTIALSSDGPTILEAALPTLPELPYSCSDGVCATCRAKVVEGAVEMDRCSGLDAAERAEGWVLTCQAHPVTERVVLDFDA
jgi:ring-1,2-phenylacetyl-CoA epoxidase subunit PaaE